MEVLQPKDAVNNTIEILSKVAPKLETSVKETSPKLT